jgi:hypothetical protein
MRMTCGPIRRIMTTIMTPILQRSTVRRTKARDRIAWLRVSGLVMVLLSAAAGPALAACISDACSDAAVVQAARDAIQDTCGCTLTEQSRRAYAKCAKRTLKAAGVPALELSKPCRNLVMRCERQSVCGDPDAVVCCRTKKSGKVVASIKRAAAKCKKGTACDSAPGRYSTFDACNPDGTCAGLLGAGGGGSASSCEQKRAAFEAALPLPVPAAPGRYVVQLVNESGETLLAAANAAHQVGMPPKAVLPREGTWVIAPGGVLTIDIPPEWEHTIGAGAVGPVFWARTGCRFDADHDLAQCETGNCSGIYDCSKGDQSAPGPKALAEWTFNDTNHNCAPDISVVDGVNLNMDIVPVGPRTEHKPSDPHWLDHTLTTCGGDLRDTALCPAPFALKRSELPTFIQGSPGGDEIVACFSNCGRYKYPLEPDLHCDADPVADPRCFIWKSFCCAFPVDGVSPYDVACTDDMQCKQSGGCWNNGNDKPVCACRAFNKDKACPPDVCTFPYTPQTPSNQPPFGSCSDVTDLTGDPSACIGDDTIHRVMPFGLTWPNDPETFFNDAHAYRIVFAPGGTSVPITPSGPIPACKDLPPAYGYKHAAQICSGVPDRVFAGARPKPASWDCKIGDGIATLGVLCRW